MKSSKMLRGGGAFISLCALVFSITGCGSPSVNSDDICLDEQVIDLGIRSVLRADLKAKYPASEFKKAFSHRSSELMDFQRENAKKWGIKENEITRCFYKGVTSKNGEWSLFVFKKDGKLYASDYQFFNNSDFEDKRAKEVK